MGGVQLCVNRVALLYANLSLHKLWFTIVHPNFPQVMDSQTNWAPWQNSAVKSILLGGGNSDDELRENDLEVEMEDFNLFHTTIAHPNKKHTLTSMN